MTHKSVFDDVSAELERDNLGIGHHLSADAYQLAADEAEAKLASMISENQKSEREQELEERLSNDSIRNLQRHYEDAKKKIEQFGKDIIRTIASEYIIHHNAEVASMFKVDYSIWEVEKRVKILHAAEHTKPGDWVALDSNYVAYFPKLSIDPLADKPKPIVFNIPYNFLPSLFMLQRTKEEIANEGEDTSVWGSFKRRLDLSVRINMGDIEIDAEGLFKNFYLARAAGTTHARIPFVLKRIGHSGPLNFSVRIPLGPETSNSNRQDILLPSLVKRSRETANQTVVDINVALTRILDLEIAKRELDKSLSNL